MKKGFNLASSIIAIATALAIFSLAGAYTNLDNYLADYHLYLLLAYLIVVLVLRVPTQISVGAGLVLLLGTPITSLLIGEYFAKQMAIYAFYFLSIGLICTIISTRMVTNLYTLKRKGRNQKSSGLSR